MPPLTRIKKFSDLGNFKDCKQDPKLTFAAINLIYAPNSYGKTTLSDVLSCLGRFDNNGVLAKSRVKGNAPSVSLLFGNTEVKFEKNQWVGNPPPIAVYNEDFVRRNVYAEGIGVNIEQRRGAFELILGDDGVNAQAQKGILIEERKVLQGDKKAAENQIKPYLVSFPVADFMSLGVPKKGENKKLIEKTETTIRRLTNFEQINKMPFPKLISRPSVPENLKDLLEATISEISPENLKIVEKHKEKHGLTGGKGEGWLASGVSFGLGNAECPLCDQSLEQSNVFEDLKAFFSEAVRTLQTDLAILRGKISEDFSEKAYGALKTELEGALEAIGQWEVTLEKKFPAPELKTLKVYFANFVKEGDVLIVSKLGSISEKIDLGEKKPFLLAQKLLLDELDKIDQINQQISQILKDGGKLKAGLDVSILPEEQQKLAKLKAQKLLLTDSMVTKQETLKGISAKQTKNHEDSELIETEISDLKNKFRKIYSEKLNFWLKKLDVTHIEFLIENLARDTGGYTTNCVVKIEGEPIDLIESQSSGEAPKPFFINTLSTSEKAILGLAFFLAQIETHPDDKRIVVFDDPFNSQDEARRYRTAKLIAQAHLASSQTFIFSHNIGFLCGLNKHLNQLLDGGFKGKTIKLSYSKETKTGLLTEVSFDEISKEAFEYRKEKFLKAAKKGFPEPLKIADDLRPLTEGYLRRRLMEIVPAEEAGALDGKSLGDLIKFMKTQAEIPELASIDALVGDLKEIHIFSSTTITHDLISGQKPPDEKELKYYLGKVLELIEGDVF